MSKNKYMTKYQLEHLKKRVSAEIDPIIDEAKLMRKSVVADLTASAEGKLAKKIKADVVIKDLEKAFKSLEAAQRKAKTFFTKGVSADMKKEVSYKFETYEKDRYGTGLKPEDCREQLRSWAETLAIKQAEKTPEGKKVKQLELYKASAINQVFETGLPSDLPKTLEAIFKPLGIIWNKKEALQLTNNTEYTYKDIN
jgi:hypothetical protein|tara:strand:- start:679 stop:1269 length:591 start_codon:yes stop_codon:yes gene_type:complete